MDICNLEGLVGDMCLTNVVTIEVASISCFLLLSSYLPIMPSIFPSVHLWQTDVEAKSHSHRPLYYLYIAFNLTLSSVSTSFKLHSTTLQRRLSAINL